MKHRLKPIRPPSTPRPAITIALAILIVVIAALVTLVSNIASTELPGSIKPYVGYSWPTLIVLLGLGVVFVAWQAWYNSSSSVNNGATTPSQPSMQSTPALALAPAAQLPTASLTLPQPTQPVLATSQQNASQSPGATTPSQAALSQSVSGPTLGPGTTPAPVPNAAHYHTCVLSYATEDEPFVLKLYEDLKAQGVSCWLAEQDIKNGDKLRKEIYKAIGQLDKLLLVLSQHAIESHWVEEEVDVALDRESCTPGTYLLFPLRLDETVFTTDKYWAITVRQRRIGDFRQWQQDAEYQRALQRVLRDLQV